MIKGLFFSAIFSVLGLLGADYLLKGFEVAGGIQSIIIAGILLAISNVFLKPALNVIFLPFRLITLNLFSFAINLVLVWIIIDVLMEGLMEISGLIPLFWTTLIIWGANAIGKRIIKK